MMKVHTVRSSLDTTVLNIIRDCSLPNLIFDICIKEISSVDQRKEMFVVSKVSHL